MNKKFSGTQTCYFMITYCKFAVFMPWNKFQTDYVFIFSSYHTNTKKNNLKNKELSFPSRDDMLIFHRLVLKKMRHINKILDNLNWPVPLSCRFLELQNYGTNNSKVSHDFMKHFYLLFKPEATF